MAKKIIDGYIIRIWWRYVLLPPNIIMVDPQVWKFPLHDVVPANEFYCIQIFIQYERNLTIHSWKNTSMHDLKMYR